MLLCACNSIRTKLSGYPGLGCNAADLHLMCGCMQVSMLLHAARPDTYRIQGSYHAILRSSRPVKILEFGANPKGCISPEIYADYPCGMVH